MQTFAIICFTAGSESAWKRKKIHRHNIKHQQLEYCSNNIIGHSKTHSFAGVYTVWASSRRKYHRQTQVLFHTYGDRGIGIDTCIYSCWEIYYPFVHTQTHTHYVCTITAERALECINANGNALTQAITGFVSRFSWFPPSPFLLYLCQKTYDQQPWLIAQFRDDVWTCTKNIILLKT